MTNGKKWPAIPKQQRRRFWRVHLFAFQGGKCHWCDCNMILAFHEILPVPENLATIDHLDDRFSDERGSHGYGAKRTVLSCNACNFKRAVESQSKVPIEELRERCRQHKIRAPQIGVPAFFQDSADAQ